MYELIRMNKVRSAVLVLTLAVLMMTVGYVFAELIFGGTAGRAVRYGAQWVGENNISSPNAVKPYVPKHYANWWERPGVIGAAIALMLCIGLSVISYYSGGQILLQMSNARKIQHKDHPRLHNVVEEMTIAAGLPRPPDVYIIDENALNAFATGRDPNHAAVAITRGLLSKLNRDELQGVIAHEIAHVRNRDILYGTMVGIMVGVIVLLCDFYWRYVLYGGGTRRRSSRRDGGQAQLVMLIVGIVLMILAPIVAQALYFAFSRRREYLADATAAELTRYPEGLASALEKIANDSEKFVSATRATAPLFIINPLQKSGVGLTGLFSTHPPTARRIAVLRTMVAGASVADYFKAMNTLGAGIKPPKSLLAESKPVEKRTPTKENLNDKIRAHRQAQDVVKRLNQFLFLTCTCGVTLKIPPGYKKKQVKCPKCGRVFAVPAMAAAVAQGQLRPPKT